MDYTILINATELQSIGLALAERPFKEVAGLIPKLQQQISEQETCKLQPPDYPKKPKDTK